MGIIYKITNNINGKLYIGQTIQSLNNRKCAHKYASKNRNKNKNRKLYNAINKHGWNNFEWEILYDNVPNNLLDIAEICAIYTYDTFYLGYNSTHGGDSSGPKSEETCKKISMANGGKNNPMYGVTHSKEYKEKMSKAMSGKNNGFYGKKHSIISLKKMSESHRGQTFKAKNWEITDPQNNIFIIHNLSKYCRENNLHHAHMISVSKDKRNHHKRYKCKKLS